MRKRKLFILFAIYVVCMTGILINRLNQIPVKTVDVTMVNDAKMLAMEHPNESLKKIYKHKNYDFSFAVLDSKGNVRYVSDKYAKTNEYDVISAGGSSVQFEGGLFYLSGTALEYSRQVKQEVFYIGMFILAGATVFGIVLLLYLRKKIIKPFWKMRWFAKNIAEGNFDIPLTMDKDNLFGAFTESFDLMRSELMKAREKEREATQSKKELVASLSHDIKTPLASIKVMTELLEVKASDESNKEKLRTIDQKTEQIQLLTDNLFHATLEELQELKVTAAEEESTILNMMINQADYQKKLLDCQVEGYIIQCDKLRTQQIFDNIISNSYKYAGTGIFCTSRICEDYLVVTVIDGGNGVNEDELPLLTQKFYRGSNTAGKTGSGIGLYMCDYFMKQMGGKMEVSNGNTGFQVDLYFLLA